MWGLARGTPMDPPGCGTSAGFPLPRNNHGAPVADKCPVPDEPHHNNLFCVRSAKHADSLPLSNRTKIADTTDLVKESRASILCKQRVIPHPIGQAPDPAPNPSLRAMAGNAVVPVHPVTPTSADLPHPLNWLHDQ